MTFLGVMLLSATVVTMADGTQIHYIERRPPQPASDVALVFLPGWMMPGAIWKHQLDAFGAKHRVIALDPRSQGDSSKTADGNYPAQRAKDLREVILQRDVQRFILVAATGSVVDAAAYVDQFGTDRVAALVFVHGVAGADYDIEGLQGLLRWAQRVQTDRATHTESLVRSLFTQRPAPAEDVRWLTAEAMKMPTHCAIAAFFGSLTADFRATLPKIDKPALIVVGESRWHDQYETMRKAIPGARLVKIPGAAHAPYLEMPSAFNAALEELIASLASPPQPALPASTNRSAY